jgi:hypothetical protein
VFLFGTSRRVGFRPNQDACVWGRGAFMSMSVRLAGNLILSLCVIGCSKQSDEAPRADGSQQSAAHANVASSSSIGEAVKDINSILDEIEAQDRKLPHREFDPAALATALGTDPKAQYKWVRDHTIWVPYRGLLRGARGVLLDRVGSSVDRAVLLGDLLRRTGHDVRLAHAMLSQPQATDLLVAMKPSRPQRPGSHAAGANSAPIYAEALALANARTGSLLVAFEDAAGRSRSDSSAVEAMRDHWWVEYLADGKWVALDLLAAAADPGGTLIAAEHEYAWERANEKPPVPDAVWHSVRLSVVVERYDGAATAEAAVLEHVLRPAEVLGTPIELTHYPAPWPDDFPFSADQPNALADAAVQVKQWVPMLLIGDRIVDQAGVADDGSIIAAPFSTEKAIADTGGGGFMVGFGEALGGGETPQSSMTAEWLDLEFHVPGSAPRTIRRPVFDVLGPQKRAARISGFDAATNDLMVKRYQALIGVYSILIQPCAFTEDYVSHLAMNTFLETRGDVQRLAVEKDASARRRIAASIEARMEVWNPLSRLAHMRFQLSREPGDWFIDRPNVLILGNGLPIVNADKAALVEFIDIASNSVGVRPDPTLSAFQIRVRQGVIDTVAEQVALAGTLDQGENTATTFAFGDADAWQLISPRDLPAARKLEWPDDVVARLAEDLDAGYAAYVPGKAFDNGGGPRWGWWRVDPSSGETVGVMDTGMHTATVEKKVTDMTNPEKAAFRNANMNRVRQLRRLRGSYGDAALSSKDRLLMTKMRQIEDALGAAIRIPRP